MKPPKAKKIPHTHLAHNDKRLDPYYWMKLSDDQKLSEKPDLQTQDVLDYLEEENIYTKEYFSESKAFEEDLFQEIKGRIAPNDKSVPYFLNGFYYNSKYSEGKEYPIYERFKFDDDKEVILDVNIEGEKNDFYQVRGMSISSNNKIMAYGEDKVSRRQYTIKFKDLVSNTYYEDEIPNTTGTIVWANDNKTIFYVKKDDSLRAFKIFRHLLGTPITNDVEVYHEKDATFNAFVYKSKSRDFIIIGSWATVSQEYWFLSADNPTDPLKLFQKRERNLEYSIAHFKDHWYIRTNKDNAKNFKIMTCSLEATDKEKWQEFIPHDPEILVEGTEIFKSFLVIPIRKSGISEILIIPWDSPHTKYIIDFPEKAHTVEIHHNYEYNTETLRLSYTSLTTPMTTFDYRMDEKLLEERKKQKVIGGYNSALYTSERLHALGRDGTSIPISIVYKNGFLEQPNKPVLLYAYGSYGHSIDPYFSSVRLSLLDRGFAFAIAHIRGGQEMGRHWYEEGKLLNKKNTFFDFIDCGKYLISKGYVTDTELFAMGGSAGGLLMGAVMNLEPSMWKGIIAAVPFVDVVTTMLDESIPLTTGEYDEWGNPNDKDYYNYIKTYSPYDNVKETTYPNTLITTGYHDSQVQYWEPAKWIARLRDHQVGDNVLLLYTNMEAGHGGQSGRYRRYKEVAMEYTFLLKLAKRINPKRS